MSFGVLSLIAGLMLLAVPGSAATPAAPRIQWFEPEVGPVGTHVRISGWNFHDVEKVTFGGVAARFWLKSDDNPGWLRSIVAEVPRSARDGNIVVTTARGSDESTSPFRLTAGPVAVSSPRPLHCGSAVTIYDTQGINPLFRGLVGSLQHRTCVDVWLPGVLRTEGEYAVIDAYTDSNHYAVNLTVEKSCDTGAHVCTDAIIRGSYVGNDPPPIPGKPHRLGNGTMAYFEPSKVFAYPSNATLTWRVGSFEYEIETKSDGEADLVRSADSMVRISSRV